MKISELARKTARFIRQYNTAENASLEPIGGHVERAINEACKPLVEALTEINGMGADSRFSVANHIAEIAKDAVLAHRKEHGE